MLYHASNISGIKVLKPQISTHQKPYVYAIRSRLMAMLFGTPKDDFDLLIDAQDGKPVLYECYPDAFKSVYAGKSCSIYTVEEAGFLQGVTGWEEEWVCPNAVPVVQEEGVEDIYAQLMLAFQAGECIMHPFTQNEKYLAFIREELQKRVEAFGISEEYRQKDQRFVQYHNKLLSL